MFPHAKSGLREAYAMSPSLHPIRYRDVVRMCHSRRRRARRRVNRVIVGPDNIWENVVISVGILVGEIFTQLIANRSMRAFDEATFNVGIRTRLKLNGLAF